jgi:hypothetical protein
LRVLEHQWGRPPEKLESETPVSDGEPDFEKMTTAELQAFVRERKAELAGGTAQERRASADKMAETAKPNQPPPSLG